MRQTMPKSAAISQILLVLSLVSPGIAGCSSHDQPQAGQSSSAKPTMLTIRGYNYTNRHIGSFSVDGQGGGNIYVSTPTSGGGGTMCCVLYAPGNPVRKVVVRWEADACYYHVKSTISSDVFDELHPLFKQREVTIDENVPPHAQNLEIHFYPDGSIKAAITAEISLPRLRLDPAREDKSRYPRCPNDRKPED